MRTRYLSVDPYMRGRMRDAEFYADPWEVGGVMRAGVVGDVVEWLTDDLGFDDAVDYSAADDLYAAVGDACPEGVDVYFDNVGGEIADAAFAHLNVRGRVAVCGQISQYNATEQPTGPRKLGGLIETRARVQGFLVSDFAARADEATERLAEWIEAGDVQYRETVTEGFENAPEAFMGLFEGVNIGKQVVKVEAGED